MTNSSAATDQPSLDVPTLEAIRATRKRLGELVVTTPTRPLMDDAIRSRRRLTTRQRRAVGKRPRGA
jgi:hypothetical protein